MLAMQVAADFVSALPMGTTPDNGGGEAPGFVGTLLSNARTIILGAVAILLLSATAAGLVFGALQGRIKKTLNIAIAVLIALLPLGIVVTVGVVGAATGIVDISGF